MAILKEDKTKYTKEEYFALLEDSLEKLEFVDGTIFTMAGGTANHNRIKEDLSGHLFGQLDDCRPLGSDMAVFVEAANAYYYPDLVYVCEEQDNFADDNQTKLTNPSVLIEILSKGTEGNDRGTKFHNYWSLHSLREYILIDSRSRRIDIFIRDNKRKWTMLSYTQPGDIVPFKTLGAEVSIDKIYQRVNLIKKP